MFFPKIRAHAKWVFVLLAIVFAGSFVFLGVGSGSSGLGDLLSGVYGPIPQTSFLRKLSIKFAHRGSIEPNNVRQQDPDCGSPWGRLC